MEEIWKDIEGFENYMISNMGRVYTKKRQRVKGGIRSYYLSNCGYCLINLSKNGKYYRKSIHRLVAESFIGNPDNKSQVNHLNGIKTDNRVFNLEWVTHNENYIHAKDILKIDACKSRPVIGINIKNGDRLRFNSIREANRNGFHRGAIFDCCNHELNKKTHHGYSWTYDTENL